MDWRFATIEDARELAELNLGFTGYAVALELEPRSRRTGAE